MKVVARVGPLLPADPNGNDVTVQAECVLVILVVAYVQNPIAAHTSPFGCQSVPFIGSCVHHEVDHLVTSKYMNMLQASARCEDPPAGLCFLLGLAVVHGQRQTFVFDPHAWQRSKLSRQLGLPLLDLLRTWRGFRFGAMIADYADPICAAQFSNYIRSRSPGDDDAWI
jgi:hypothetical protein